MSGKVVCITGIDGAGKTTLSKAVVTRLRADGVGVKYAYAKYVAFTTRPIMRLANKVFLRRKDIWRDYRAYSDEKKTATRKHPLLARLFRSMVMTEYVIQVFFKVRLPAAFGRTVICDRYVHDTLVTDFGGDFGLDADEIERRLDRSFRWFPRPHATLFLDLPEDVALSRKTDVPDVEYLRDRRHLYREIARRRGFLALDGTRNPDDLAREAVGLILPVIKP